MGGWPRTPVPKRGIGPQLYELDAGGRWRSQQASGEGAGTERSGRWVLPDLPSPSLQLQLLGALSHCAGCATLLSLSFPTLKMGITRGAWVAGSVG